MQKVYNDYTTKLAKITRRSQNERKENRSNYNQNNRIHKRVADRKAQLVENIIKEFVYGTDEAENEEAKEIFQYIQESKCDLDKLAKWTINNNKFETFRLGLEVWKTLIAERERKIRYHRSNQDAT